MLRGVREDIGGSTISRWGCGRTLGDIRWVGDRECKGGVGCDRRHRL